MRNTTPEHVPRSTIKKDAPVIVVCQEELIEDDLINNILLSTTQNLQYCHLKDTTRTKSQFILDLI